MNEGQPITEGSRNRLELKFKNVRPEHALSMLPGWHEEYVFHLNGFMLQTELQRSRFLKLFFDMDDGTVALHESEQDALHSSAVIIFPASMVAIEPDYGEPGSLIFQRRGRYYQITGSGHRHILGSGKLEFPGPQKDKFYIDITFE